MSFATQTGNAIQNSLRETSTAGSEENKQREIKHYTSLHIHPFYRLQMSAIENVNQAFY